MQVERLEDRILLRGADASGEIRIRGLRRSRSGECEVTVTPTAGPFGPQSQRVRIPSGGVSNLEFVFGPTSGRAGLDVAGYFVVTGNVRSPDSGVAGLRVLVVDKNVGGDRPLGDAMTDKRGRYEVRFGVEALKRGRKEQLDLQARVYLRETFLGASEVRYDATARETLDVRLPAKAAGRAPEYESLTSAITTHFTGRLADLKETQEQQDITYLANKTGWDARAVALAALADQFSEVKSVAAGSQGIPSPFYYALFRAGYPANAETLYHADSGVVKRVWKSAMNQGVIPASLEEKIPAATEAFAELGAEKLLTTPLPGGVSGVSEMLSASGLEDSQQKAFATLYSAHRDNPTVLWKSVEESFGSELASQLRTNARIGFLTLNNAPLLTRLQKAVDVERLSDPIQLATGGFYRPQQWAEVIDDGTPIPEQIAGDTQEARRRNYTNYLAAMVRLSYPTASVAQMVSAGELEVDSPADVSEFLSKNQSQFEIGMQPVQQYIARQDLDVPAATVDGVRRIQRLYQITASDDVMGALLRRKIDSAAQIVQFDKAAFVDRFAVDLGGAEVADEVHDKAAQIYNTVLNVAVSFLTARNGVGLGAPLAAPGGRGPAAGPGSLGAQVVDPQPGNPGADVIAYPTLEGLFGEMDFCACEHCRSNLSPAAYLVDLLNFIDIAVPPAGSENPQSVLLQRRPDVQHLPLTCENTNTALPYIDVVNEALEYFIANDVNEFSLDDYVGHDTDDSESADLLARPQFVLDEAYKTLRGQRFPLSLPFYRSLEGLRVFFDEFDVPLARAMIQLRAHEELRPGPASYGWRDILIEEIGVSRQEFKILTDFDANPLWRIYGFANGTPDDQVIAALSNAKAFSRRLNLSYVEVVDLLKTQFINPNAALIPKLEALGVPLTALIALKDGSMTGAEFDALLPTGAGAPDPADYGGDIKAWVTDDDNFARIMDLIVLTDPNADPDPCKFENLEFRHAQPASGPGDTTSRLGVVEFVRLLRFVRLWKRTGWSIHSTDAAIRALYQEDFSPFEAADVDETAELDAGFERLLLRIGILLRVIDALGLSAQRDLLPLLACWAPIGTYGEDSLYATMLLNPAILEQDDVFADNGVGEFLPAGSGKLLKHEEALRSAFNLTGDEFAQIVTTLEFDEDTKLNVPNLSAIFRHGWLARKLKLSVREFVLFKTLTGLDPFSLPDPVAPAILRLTELTRALKERGFRSSAVLYLLWNQDLSGRSAPEDAQLTEFARTLRNDFVAIEEDLAIVEDPGGDLVQARLALLYGSEAAATFVSFLDGTLELDVPYSNPRPKLKVAIQNADPGIGYDHFRKRLLYSGVMTVERRDALQTVANPPPGFTEAVDALFDRSEDTLGSFFARFPDLEPLYDNYVASSEPVEKKRRALLSGFRPQLLRQRKREQALQRLGAVASGVDVEFTKAIVDSPKGPHPLHADGRPNRPGLDDLLRVGRPGLAVQFFFRATATGNVDLELEASKKLDYAPDTGNALPEPPGSGNVISGIWRGWIETPDTGFYNIVIEANAGATVKLSIDGEDRPLTRNGRIRRNSDSIELDGAELHEVVVTVEKLRRTLRVSWETPDRPREVIPGRYLYPPSVLAPMAALYTRFFKTASLASALKLTAKEIAHFATHADYRMGGEGWLNKLPLNPRVSASRAARFLEPLEALLDFSRIKATLSPDDESLLKAIQDPSAATADPDSLLFTLTRWDRQSLDDLVGHFDGAISDLAGFEFFVRVYEAFELSRKMGIAGAALIDATTNAPDARTLRDLESALRARYEASDWRDLVQPLNDTLRGMQRDALVEYILHEFRSRPATDHIDTPEKLFEYFLMDVQMEPCMQTSRIRHAIATVQLFIERCLMNLEPRVSPAALNASQWEWMKRYRVWEANRKIFLFPENWLEPELRDDKSPFFTELESELLQSDITEESAASALLNYLSKLEGVAKLQPCGLFHVEANPDLRTGTIDHVVARTPGANRSYFYRRREYGYWTPWEPIKLDIEDNPVIPVVWRDRLMLFWLRLTKEGPNRAEKPTGGGNLTDLTTSDLPGDPRITVKSVLAWSEFFNGKWQPAKTSDIDLPAVLTESLRQGGLSTYRKSLKLVAAEKDGVLYIGIDPYQYTFSQPLASFILRNTNSSPEEGGSAEFAQPDPRFALSFTGHFALYYGNVVGDQVSYSSILDRKILKPSSSVGFIRTVDDLHQPMSAPFEAPFFAEDQRHTFFVRTKQDLVRIQDHLGIGSFVNVGMVDTTEQPPVIVAEIPVMTIPEFWGIAGPLGPDPGTVNPGPVEQFISEDAYIQQGLGSGGVVKYGDQQIGPQGSVQILEKMK